MSEVIVLGFKDMTAADEVVPQLEAMQRERLIELSDWARVIRREDGKIDVRQATNEARSGVAGGALFGMIGLLFLMPLAGLAIGAVTGAIMGNLADYGIDDTFIKEVGRQIKLGTSALFLYVEQATTDKAIDRLKAYEPIVLRTSLSEQTEEQLRTAMQPEARA